MLADGTVHDRFIPPEADPSNPRAVVWRICSWDGVTDFHSAASRFHRCFVLLFVAVTAFSAWFMTSSPRLSYFGIQVVVLFTDQCERIQNADLTRGGERPRRRYLASDCFAMWLIFDKVWGVPAARELKETFISNLRLARTACREQAQRT